MSRPPSEQGPDTVHLDTDHPGTDQPGTDHPGTDHPDTDQPGTDQPDTDQPPPSRPEPSPSAAKSTQDASPLGLGRQLRRSFLRHDCRDTPGNRIQVIVNNVWLHLHPVRVPQEALRFRFTLCAGGITFLLFLVTVVTGGLLMFYYRPTSQSAHSDVLSLTQSVPLGAFVRSLHRFAGDGMVIATLVHLLRVLLTRSYRPPRELNWVVGVGLLLLTLGIAFTGYLLPWDQRGFWATTVATHMVGATPVLGADGPASLVSPDTDLKAALLGGPSIGPWTLARFYALHCVVLPALAVLLMAWHFWRVRKDGISRPL